MERFERAGSEVYYRRTAVLEAIADVGAGTGLYTGLFSDKVGPQGKVMAVDIVRLFLSRIMDRAKETGRKNIQTVLGSGQSTRLPAASFDKVFICDTYHHFEYPKSMLALIHQALKPGGEILAAGFEEVTALSILKDNYVVRFRKKSSQAWKPRHCGVG